MRASEFLYEDHRTKIQKLEELIDHPSTEETIRIVARSRLKILQQHQLAIVPIEPPARITVPVNISESDLDTYFVPGIKLGYLYDGLCNLSPAPNNIRFLRQGQIQMMVPPPFMGKTKIQYLKEINAVTIGALHIDSKMVEGHGYSFTISYV